jgi:hypothetical protein
MSSPLLETIYLPTLENYSYAKAKEFSKKLDHELGFKIQQVEQNILKDSPHIPWAGLEPEVLQTPYPEIRMMLEKLSLQKGQTLIDLGAGYGRVGLVISHFYPEVNFIGYEISPDRVSEGCRILKPNERVCLLQEDISRSDFKIPISDVYFIYDFGDLESIIRVIDQLKEISKFRKIQVLGRGRRTRDHIERQEPWLSQIIEPVHCGNFSIYQNR